MEDHPAFQLTDNKIDIILAEVKTGQCRLNGPWTNPEKENMQRVLYAIGAFPKKKVDIVADALYKYSFYADELFCVRLFAIGREKNSGLNEKVVQLTWEEISGFIYERFNKYRKEKAHHPQWDYTGKYLYKLSNTEKEKFIEEILNSINNFIS
jgi:hypothetical protein